MKARDACRRYIPSQFEVPGPALAVENDNQRESSRFANIVSSVLLFMKISLWLLFALASGAAQAEIYACNKHGVMTYQNFPCPFNSLGSLPTGTTAAPTPPVTSEAPVKRAETSGSTAAGAAAAGRTAAPPAASVTPPYSPRIGSSSDDVRKLWGEPEEVVQDEPPKGRIEIWRYKDGRAVEIGRHNRVVAVQL